MRPNDRHAIASALRLLADALERGESDSNADGWVDLRTVPLPRRTLYSAARSGALRATKLGRRWLARKSDVDRWVSEHTDELSASESLASHWEVAS